jgi:hypothetical protein
MLFTFISFISLFRNSHFITSFMMPFQPLVPRRYPHYSVSRAVLHKVPPRQPASFRGLFLSHDAQFPYQLTSQVISPQYWWYLVLLLFARINTASISAWGYWEMFWFYRFSQPSLPLILMSFYFDWHDIDTLLALPAGPLTFDNTHQYWRDFIDDCMSRLSKLDFYFSYCLISLLEFRNLLMYRMRIVLLLLHYSMPLYFTRTFLLRTMLLASPLHYSHQISLNNTSNDDQFLITHHTGFASSMPRMQISIQARHSHLASTTSFTSPPNRAGHRQ